MWLGLGLLLACAAQAGPVRLDASTRSIDLWPALSMLSDPSHTL